MEEDIVVVVVADYDAAQPSSEHVGVEHVVAAAVEEAEEPLPEIHYYYYYDDATMMTTLPTLRMLLSYPSP